MGRSTTWRQLIVATVITLSTVLVAGCTSGGSGTPGGSSAPARTLTIGATASPNSMDPTTNSAAAIPQVLLYNVYETLVKLDSAGEIRPLLAAEWSVSTDRTVYTFKLQPSAKFASGAPVDAEAVVASIERVMTLDGITPVNKTQMSVVKGAKAVDATTVEVTLNRPSNNWLYDMSQTAGVIIDPAGDADLATTPAGSGPYKLTEWLKGESVTLERNPDYWGTAPRFDKAVFRYFTDPTAQNSAMASGDLDIISNVTAPQALAQFEDESRFTIHEGTTNGEIVMGLNNARPALQDVRVRQAINYALDRQALMDTVWGGYGMLIGSMVPPTDPWYEDLSGTYPYNPEKARELLAEAGHANGLTLALRVPTLPYATGSAQFIVSQLAEVGITVTVDELEFPARWIDEVMVKSNYDMTIVSHVEGRDIVKFADKNYYWHYDNPEFNKLVEEADTGTPEDQITKMREAAQLLADDAAACWLWLLPNLIVSRADLTGIQVNATSLSFDLTTIASRNA